MNFKYMSNFGLDNKTQALISGGLVGVTVGALGGRVTDEIRSRGMYTDTENRELRTRADKFNAVSEEAMRDAPYGIYSIDPNSRFGKKYQRNTNRFLDYDQELRNKYSNPAYTAAGAALGGTLGVAGIYGLGKLAGKI